MSQDKRQRQRAAVLRYETHEPAPKIVAKGYGVQAENIIRTARENGVFIHESPELVDLLMQVDLDQHIPPQLYVAIAELLAWLYQLESAAGKSDGKAAQLAQALTPPVRQHNS